MRKTVAKWILIMVSFTSLNACSDGTVSWQEEVKLLDGRVIVVTQKQKLQSDEITRDAWLTMNLPEFSAQPIVWHEALYPLVLNIYQGNLFIVSSPSTKREYIQYGRPQPAYVGYRWNKNQWIRIAFSDIPEAIYDSNLLFVASHPKDMQAVLTLAKKEEMFTAFTRNGLRTMDERIDPKSQAFFNE